MEPGAHERVEDIVGKLAGVVDLGCSWRDLVVGESADRLAEHPVLVGKPIDVELGISQHHDSDSRTTDYLVSVSWVDSSRAVTGACIRWFTTGERLRTVAARLGAVTGHETRGAMTQITTPPAFDAAAASTAYRNALEVIAAVEPDVAVSDAARARRSARVSEADRQRELRLARRAAGDGLLAVGQVRGGDDRPPLLRRLPERRHRRATRRGPRPSACSARRTPTSSRTRASTPTWSRSGPCSLSASRRPRSQPPAFGR